MTDSLYRQFLESFADAFFMLDGNGCFLDVNKQACVSLGYTREELLCMNVQDIAVNYNQATIREMWQGMDADTNYVIADHHYRKDGSILPVEVTISCQLVAGQKHYFTLARDMTEKLGRVEKIHQLNTELEALLQERTRQWKDSTRLLNSVMRDTSDIVFLKDLQGRYVFANPAAEKVAQLPEGASIGKTDEELIGKNNSFAADDAQALQSTTPVMATSYAVVNGQKRFFHSIKSQYRDEQGEVIGLLGISRDITQIHTAQQELRMSYDSLRRAERLSRIGSWTLELATGEFRASDMMYEMNGVDPGGPQITPEDLSKMMSPDDHARVMAAITLCAQTGQAYGLDVMHYTPDRPPFPVTIRGQADCDEDGNIISVSGTVQDLSEREDAKLQLETLADNLPNGAIYRLEDDGDKLRLSYISAGIERLIGVSAAAIMGDRDAYINTILREDRPAYDRALSYSMQKVQVFDHSFRITKPDGSQRWLRCRSAPRRQNSSTIWDGILLDITREREAEQALQQAKEAAEVAERAKSDFLATMSHEIRTPMNTVIGMTRLMQQTVMSPKQRNYMEKVDISANALLSNINDILDFSKIEAGMLSLESVEFALDDILEMVSAVTTLRAEEKGLEVIYNVAPDVPSQLRGDPMRLSQVLNNLVSNAIKFTEQGEVVVAINSIPTALSGRAPTGQIMLAFDIRDTGIGMTEGQIERIFHPFLQADSQTTRRYGGTGLGLAICSRLVKLMGGEIHVTSALGVGSTFRFTAAILPARQAEPARHSFISAQPGEQILIVDDNASAREILCSLVRGFGMRADTAASGKQALMLLQSAYRSGTPYGLVLMDWRMPGMDGLEFARRIREEEHLAATPAVLMVTAYGRDEVLRRAEALQLQGLLIKPVTNSVLLNTIWAALQPQKSGTRLNELSASRSPLRAQKATQYPALARRAVLVVDDNALNREVAADFLELAGIQVHLATNGQEALKLLQQERFDAVLMDVHMPVMDGLQATRAIRALPALRKLPVIALTAQARPEDRERIEAAGMNAHLTKPLDEQQLYATLQMWIERAAVAPAHATPNSPYIKHAQMHQRFHGNQQRIGRMLNGFCRDFSDAPEQLHAHLQLQQWDEINMLAHTLKSALGYLDAPALTQQSEYIELQARALIDAPKGIVTPHQKLQDAIPPFAKQLATLLASIAQTSTNEALEPGSTSTSVTVHNLEPVFAQLQALVRNGDYAAISVLERLGAQLVQPDAQALYKDLQQYVEDLDTEHALTALQHLQTLVLPSSTANP
ncbi:MAG: response regulator [Comamonas sp.]